MVGSQKTVTLMPQNTVTSISTPQNSNIISLTKGINSPTSSDNASKVVMLPQGGQLRPTTSTLG